MKTFLVFISHWGDLCVLTVDAETPEAAEKLARDEMVRLAKQRGSDYWWGETRIQEEVDYVLGCRYEVRSPANVEPYLVERWREPRLPTGCPA